MNLLLVGDWQQLFWTRTSLLLLAVAAAAADGHTNVADDCGYSSVQRRSSSCLLLLLFLLLFPAVLHVRITATTTNDDNLLRFVHSSLPPWALPLWHRNLSQSNQPSTRCSASPAVGYKRLPSLSASPADGRETSELLWCVADEYLRHFSCDGSISLECRSSAVNSCNPNLIPKEWLWAQDIHHHHHHHLLLLILLETKIEAKEATARLSFSWNLVILAAAAV
jgi:hypothetical protein